MPETYEIWFGSGVPHYIDGFIIFDYQQYKTHIACYQSDIDG
jgi:hypothetical protein